MAVGYTRYGEVRRLLAKPYLGRSIGSVPRSAGWVRATRIPTRRSPLGNRHPQETRAATHGFAGAVEQAIKADEFPAAERVSDVDRTVQVIGERLGSPADHRVRRLRQHVPAGESAASGDQ
jgi:hypothetical protein